MVKALKKIISEEKTDVLKKIFNQMNDSLGWVGVFIKESDMDMDIRQKNPVIAPIAVAGKKLGNLYVYNEEKEYVFSDEDLFLIEWVSCLVSVIVAKAEEEAVRDRRNAKNAIAMLSYSELEAAVHIVKELKGDEGVLVLSKIAEESGIGRSAIGSAIRKLESAGAVEARSLGMKGSFIKIINDRVVKELRKLG